MAAVGTTFNVFSYDAVWAENLTLHLPNAGRMRYMFCYTPQTWVISPSYIQAYYSNYFTCKLPELSLKVPQANTRPSSVRAALWESPADIITTLPSMATLNQINYGCFRFYHWLSYNIFIARKKNYLEKTIVINT